MKLWLILILFPLFCPAALPEGDFLGSRTCQFEGVFYDFPLTKAALAKAPKWNQEESEFPPLSPRQAQSAAINQIKALFPKQHQFLHVYTIALESIYATDWIYLVTFDYSRPEGFYSGPPRRFVLPVYFDGSTITPRMRKEK